jgi:DNA processing protein
MSVAWVALNAIKGLGPVGLRQLIMQCTSAEELLERSPNRLIAEGLISEPIARQLRDPSLREWAERQVEECRRRGYRIVTLADSDYPSLLRQIFAPPPVLYVRGNSSAFTSSAVAVVGSRRPDHYGERVTATFVRDLVRSGLTIVSGLALGIDAIAHQACLDNEGCTIAVLGSGVDNFTPATNRRLGERIVETGAVISEFPLGAPPEPYHFPRRNRIVSGLAAGVVVVEAGSKSGALITAQYALQQGRDVFAVPGSIFSERCEGTFKLIREGATPVRSAADIVEALRTPSLPLTMDPAPRATLPSAEALSPEERLTYEAITHEPRRMDQIADQAGKSIAELFDILLNLELKGLIRQVAGQLYIRV